MVGVCTLVEQADAGKRESTSARRSGTRSKALDPGPVPELPKLLEQPSRLMQMEREVVAEFRPKMLAALEQRVQGEAMQLEGSAPRCSKCQRAMTRRGKEPRTLLTLFGELTFKVQGFRCKPCKMVNTPVVAHLGIEPGHLSGALARLVALLGVVAPFALAATLVKILLGIEVDEMVVWREVKRLGQSWDIYEEEVSRHYGDVRNTNGACDAAPDVVLLETDGATLCMQGETRRKRDEPRPSETTTAGEPSEYREVKTGVLLLPSERVQKGERRSLVRRVLVSCLGNADQIFARLFAKLCELGWMGHNTLVVIIGDGAEWIWNRVTIFPRRCEILDFWHAVERVWEFARLHFGADSKRAADWAHDIAQRLRRGDVAGVIESLEAMALGWPPLERESAPFKCLQKLIKYYSDNAARMRYDEYLRAGWGIGSGAVESAHKQVLQARLRQAGMRWTEQGARHLLALRVLLLNGQWERLDQVRRSSLAA